MPLPHIRCHMDETIIISHKDRKYAAGGLAFVSLLVGFGLWLANQRYGIDRAIVMVGFVSAFFLWMAGRCEERITNTDITLKGVFTTKKFRWQDVIQVGILMEPGGKGPPQPRLAFTMKNGFSRESGEGWWRWLRKNTTASCFTLEYNTRTLKGVHRYYGPLDFDECGKPPQSY